MSQETGQIVRKPLRVRERSGRTLDERLLVRFPRLAAAYVPRVARLVARLPPSSRLRQAMLARSMRGDDGSVEPPRSGCGAAGPARGLRAPPAPRVRRSGTLGAVLSGPGGLPSADGGLVDIGTHARIEPSEFIDLGDRLVCSPRCPRRHSISRDHDHPQLRQRHCSERGKGYQRDRVRGPRRGPRSRGAVGVGQSSAAKGKLSRPDAIPSRRGILGGRCRRRTWRLCDA